MSTQVEADEFHMENELAPLKRQLEPTSTEEVSTFVTFPSCRHLTEQISTDIVKNYNMALRICVMPTTKSALCKLRAQILRCHECRGLSGLWMCLDCPHVGCVEHAKDHSRGGHHFGVNESGQVICFECDKFVGHPRLERVRILRLQEAGMLSTYPGLPVYKCEHNADREKRVIAHSRVPTFKASKGLKGFINMGSTCFMSSILQVVVHNPFIRDYYMSGAHLDCPKSPDDCISCCVNEIFQDFYTSTSTNGYGPSSLLTAAWKVKKSLAGYSQQDAHEFWQFLIHQIHKNDTQCTSREVTPENGKSPRCNCITHRIFAGELQSTLTCTNCGNSRVTVDPMLDLSLEIQHKTLVECLDRFTNAEKLDIMYECPNCKTTSGVTKQLKLRRLPPTLCIQLKRFEHHVGVSSKIDTHVGIPLMLDLSKYTLGSSRACIYELYAVVYHIGSVNTGHYIALVKTRDGIWFKFDDAKVIRISEKEVLDSQAYLLFYIIHEMP